MLVMKGDITMTRSLRLGFAILFVSVQQSIAEERTWQNATSDFAFKAELVAANGNKVRLRWSEDGKEYDVPLHVLSQADQAYVRAKIGTAGKSKSSEIPDDVLSRIKAKAAKEWPGDFHMQGFVIKQQKEAYLQVRNYSNKSVPPVVLERIIRKALNEWPDDFHMQHFVIKQQVTAYGDLANDD